MISKLSIYPKEENAQNMDKSRISYQNCWHCLNIDKSQWKIARDLSISNQTDET